MNVVVSSTQDLDELLTLYRNALVAAGFQLQDTSGDTYTYKHSVAEGTVQLSRKSSLYDEIQNNYKPGLQLKLIPTQGRSLYYSESIFNQGFSKFWLFTAPGVVHFVARTQNNTYTHAMLCAQNNTVFTWGSGKDENRILPGLGNNQRSEALHEGIYNSYLKFATSETRALWGNRVSVRNPFLVLFPIGFGISVNYVGTVTGIYACNGYNLPIEEEYMVGERKYMLFPSYVPSNDVRIAVDVTQ